MDDQYHLVYHTEFGQRPFEKPLLLSVRVRVGTRVDELVRIAHTDKIQSNAPTVVCKHRHHITPEITRRRIPMLKNDGHSFAHFNVRHAAVTDFNETLRVFLRRRHLSSSCIA